jgi:heptosyltransferase-3
MRAPSVNLSQRLTLSQLAALMERAALFVGLDTGPMHIAAAFGVPVVVLLPQRSQQSVHGRWYPYGSDYIALRGTASCEGCVASQCVRHTQDEELACTASLPVESVVDAATALLAGADHPGLVRWREESVPAPVPG